MKINVSMKKEEGFELFNKFFEEVPSFLKVNDTYSTNIEENDNIFVFNFLKKEENITQVSINAIYKDIIKCCGFDILETKEYKLV